MKKILSLITFCCIFIAFTACNSDSDEPTHTIPADASYDFATLTARGSSTTTFQLRKSDDSPLITYMANTAMGNIKDVEVGDRMIICYKPTGHQVYTDGMITLYGVVFLTSTDQTLLTGTAADYNDFYSIPLTMQVLNRTGNYINVQALASVMRAEKPEKFVLVADQASLSSKNPDLHVVYITPDGNDGPNQLAAYGSFDISSVWNNPDYDGVTVHYQSLGGPRSVNFSKNNPVSPEELPLPNN